VNDSQLLRLRVVVDKALALQEATDDADDNHYLVECCVRTNIDMHGAEVPGQRARQANLL